MVFAALKFSQPKTGFLPLALFCCSSGRWFKKLSAENSLINYLINRHGVQRAFLY